MRSVRGILELPPDVITYDIDMYCYDLENTWYSLHINQCRCRVLKMSREHERIQVTGVSVNTHTTVVYVNVVSGHKNI